MNPMDPARLGYVSIVIEPSSGTMNKLESQAKACARAGLPVDFYWIGRGRAVDASRFPHLNLVRVAGSNAVAIRLQQVGRLHELLSKYDRLALRYPWWDPVLHGLLRDKGRIILEMHTANVPQLKAEGSWRYLPELLTSSWLRGFGGMMGVTPEIVETEVARSRFRGKTAFIPNSIDPLSYEVEDVPLVRRDEPRRVVMVASRFYRWHGLERILGAVHSFGRSLPFQLHLYGSLTDRQLSLAAGLPDVVVHDPVDRASLVGIYSTAHAGLAGFDLGAIGLSTATPLKTREYLASGLPVVGGYRDAGLPSDFPYQLALDHFDIMKIAAYIDSVGHVSRRSIQEAAANYIDNLVASRAMYDFCMSA